MLMKRRIMAGGLVLALICPFQVYAIEDKTEQMNLVSGQLKLKDGREFHVLIQRPEHLKPDNEDYVRAHLMTKNGNKHIFFIKRKDATQLEHGTAGTIALDEGAEGNGGGIAGSGFVN